LKEAKVMRKTKQSLRHWLMAFLHPRPLIGLFYLPRFLLHYMRYVRASEGVAPGLADMQPCLGDWISHTPFDAHYFYQGAWLARRLAKQAPDKHVDIGSSVLTIGVLSAHVDTVFVDFRPIKANLSSLMPLAGNILELTFADDSISSLSCLHVIEHIGLGRYGDPIDPLGSIKAAIELQRVLAHGGRLYLSLPVGRQRICFNAHRVHAPAMVLEIFSQLKLVEFSWVDDAGGFHDNTPVDDATHQEYACGMFLFEKQ
jgi:SAM-dependent methyltransferase